MKFTLLFIIAGIILCSLVNATPYEDCSIYGTCKPESISTYSNITNINNTYINQTVNATVNSTQFDSNNPIHIKESWLTNFIQNIVEGYNYLTQSNADNLYCKLTGCTMNGNINMDNNNLTNVTFLNNKNVSQIVSGNMSSESVTTNTSTFTYNYSMDFDGYGDMAEISDSSDLTYMTFSAWIKPQGEYQGYDLIVGKWNDNDGDYRSFGFYIGGGGNLGLYSSSTGGDATNLFAGEVTLTQDTWYHVAFTTEGTTHKIFLDGTVIASSTEQLSLYTQDYPISLGGAKFGGGISYYSGLIDEVNIWDRTLSETEIANLYNSSNGVYGNVSVSPFNDTMLYGYHMDEGSGTTLVDFTNTNNGTIGGNPVWVEGKVGTLIETSTTTLGALGLMPYVSSTNFISTDYAMQWDCDNTTCALKTPPIAPTQTIFNIGNSTNPWDWIFVKNITSYLINSIDVVSDRINAKNITTNQINTSVIYLNNSNTVEPSINGEIRYDSNQKTFSVMAGGVNQSITTGLFTQTGDQVITNTAAELSIYDGGVGTLTLPANFFTVGKTLRLKSKGLFSATNGETTTLKVKLGNTNLVNVSSAIPATLTNSTYDFEFTLTCRSVGTNGTIIGSGRSLVAGGQGFATVSMRGYDMYNPVTIDTTQPLTINVTYKFTSASTSNTLKINTATIEIVN